MTRDRHLKATIRNRMACGSRTYTQARDEIARQLAYIEDFPYLPVVWDIARRGSFRAVPSQEEHRAALGAVELAIRDTHILSGATNRDRWRTIDGHIDLDWEGGPYAYEVVQRLIADAEDPETPGLCPGELRPGFGLLGDLDSVWIYGVRVRFRPCEPIGADASRQRAWSDLDEQLGAV